MLVEVKRINKVEATVVSSLDVAETFEKNHRDVMESIRNIESNISTAEFSALFFLDSYKASNGKLNPMYLMTRDGFTLLVMGYTGEKAMRFKLAYIKQFNAMEKALQGKLIEREKGIAVRQSLQKRFNSRPKMIGCMVMPIQHIRTVFIKFCSERMQSNFERTWELALKIT